MSAARIAVAFKRALELSAEDSSLEQRKGWHGKPGSSCRDRLVAFVLKESNGHVTAIDRIADHLARWTVHSIEIFHAKSADLPGVGRKPEELVECEGASTHSALEVTSDIAVEAIVDVGESVALDIQDALVLRVTVSLDELGNYCCCRRLLVLDWREERPCLSYCTEPAPEPLGELRSADGDGLKVAATRSTAKILAYIDIEDVVDDLAVKAR
jgi:hypothetical protein